MHQYRIVHKTEYNYSEQVGLCHNEVRLKPRDTPTQTLKGFTLEVKPEPVVTHERVDIYGNTVHYLGVQTGHELFAVVSESLIEKWESVSGDEESITVSELKKLLDHLRGDEHLEKIEFLLDSPMIQRDPILYKYGSDLFSGDNPFLKSVMNLTSRIFKDFKYQGGVTHAQTTVLESFESGKGVCQDFAHIGVGVLRSLGFPARYVSGYLETLPPPGKPKLVGSDASHAWFSVLVPGYGWFDFDPTNNIRTGPSHLTTGWGRDYSDVPPIRGVIFGGGDHQVKVSVDVEKGEEGAALN